MKNLILALALTASVSAYAGPYPTIDCKTPQLAPLTESFGRETIGPFTIQIVSSGSAYSHILIKGAYVADGNSIELRSFDFQKPLFDRPIDLNGQDLFNFFGSIYSDEQNMQIRISTSEALNGTPGFIMITNGAKSEWRGQIFCHQGQE
ncbi:MAG: hypothetical protein ACXVB9_16555 [Bdellovibrionota bacterium]